jgi:uroporphyrinogen decarboxylase
VWGQSKQPLRLQSVEVIARCDVLELACGGAPIPLMGQADVKPSGTSVRVGGQQAVAVVQLRWSNGAALVVQPFGQGHRVSGEAKRRRLFRRPRKALNRYASPTDQIWCGVLFAQPARAHIFLIVANRPVPRLSTDCARAGPAQVTPTLDQRERWKQDTPQTGPGTADIVSPLTGRERFLHACACRPLDYPPVWLMRQAGRALPEYRALKERYSFRTLVQTPELAAEVTLQPVRRFDFDAAIVFMDILVVPEALGQGYHLREDGGIQMEFPICTPKDVAGLDTAGLPEKLHYVTETIRLSRAALGGRTALLGFAGSPWTLANFMLEGGSVAQPRRAQELLHHDGRLFGALMEKLTRAVIECLQMQIQSGVDAVQLFDTLGGLLPPEWFEAGSGRWLKEIVAALGKAVPVIVFSKGTHRNWDSLVGTGAQVLGVDSRVRLGEVAARLPATVAVQGNLDPGLLAVAGPETVAARTRAMLEEMRGRPGYICNLGHGVPPQARLENIETLLSTVRAVA